MLLPQRRRCRKNKAGDWPLYRSGLYWAVEFCLFRGDQFQTADAGGDIQPCICFCAERLQAEILGGTPDQRVCTQATPTVPEAETPT